jgi:TP901 family phage tail tape measure protein
LPNTNETTTKFKVDISDLKKNIQEANRQIKLANAEFKAAASGMNDWQSSAEGLSSKIGSLKTVLSNQEKVLESYEKQLELVTAEYGENSKEADLMKIKVANQQTAVNNTRNELAKYETQLEEVSKEQEDSAKSADKQNSALEDLKQTISEQQSKLDKLKEKYTNVVIEQGKNSDSAEELAKEISDLSGELDENKSKLNNAEKAADEYDQSLEDVGDSAEDTATGGLNVFSVALGNMIANVVSDAIQKMKDLVAGTIEVGKTFDNSMGQVAAVSGATGDELQALRDKAKEMGSTTKFTASEAADAFNYMAMAGWKTEDMINGIDGVLALAAASGTDLATTSDIVTDALTAMGYSAGDAGRLADVMAAASSNANTNVEMMGATFQYAAPIVGALGYSMEDTAKQIGLMANAGIKGEKAGTALRSILTRLSAPPKEAADAMTALGISMTDSEGNMKSLDEVMGDLRNAFSGLSETQQTQYAKQIAGQEAMSGLLAIVNAAPTDIDKLTKAINESDGAAEKMADTMQDNLGGDLTKLGSKFEGLQLKLYEKFEPALRGVVGGLDKMLDAIEWLGKHIGPLEPVIVALSGALIGLVSALAGLYIIPKISAAFTAFNAVLGANPIVLVVTAIGALVAALIYLWNNCEEFRDFWIGLWKKIKKVAEPVIEDLKEIFQKAWKNIKETWEAVYPFFKELFKKVVDVVKPILSAWFEWFKAQWNFIKKVWDIAYPFFKELFKKIIDVAIPIIKTLIEWFKNAWETIKAAWEVAYSFFTDLFTSIWNSIKPIIDAVVGAFKEAWELIKVVWDLVSPYFQKIWENIKTIFSVVAPIISGFFKSAWEIIKGIWDLVVPYFQLIWETIKATFSVVKTVLGGFFSTAWESIKLVWNAVTGYFAAIWETIKEIFSVVKDVLTGNWSDAWEGIKNIVKTWAGYFSDVWKSIKGVFSSVTTWFSETFQAAWEAVQTVFSGVGTFFEGVWTTITDTFSSIGTTIGEAVSNSAATAINYILETATDLINGFIKAINGAVGMINKIPGVEISKIDLLEAPQLAKGGVLKKGQIGLLEGNGAEAVVPLENNKKWIAKTARDLRMSLQDEGLLGGSAGKNIVNNNYTFNQTNNSPKPLSRLEIYRQTKNQLNFAKGV